MVIRNFLFHRVSDDADMMWPPMKPSLFSRIISHLTQNFLVVPLEAYLQDPGAFPKNRKIATILFDDGYKDNIEYAAGILSQFRCPASFYVVTDCIDRNIPTWTYLVDHSLSTTQKNKLELSYDFVPSRFKRLDIGSGGASHPVTKELKPWMKKLSNAQRLLITRSILEQCNDVPVPRAMMGWDDIRQLHQQGFIIGSHSHTHPLLASLQDETEILSELNISARRIREETGTDPLTISYPIGSFDERVIEFSKKEGYRFGLAVKQRFYKPGMDDPYEIPRAELYQEPWWKVKMRMNGMYSRLKSIWP